MDHPPKLVVLWLCKVFSHKNKSIMERQLLNKVTV